MRPDDLLQALNEHKPHVVHFSGHGIKSGEILLMDNNRKVKPVSIAALKMLFTTLKDNIRVVVLNVCYSQEQAEAIRGVIDCTIGMNTAIGDQAAITFAASFYRAIGFGRSIQESFDQGRAALLLEGIHEENSPEMLARRGVDPNSVILIGHPDQSQSDKRSHPGSVTAAELPLKIVDASILRGDPTSGYAIEILLHNPEHKEFFINRATIGSWRSDTHNHSYFEAPPIYTYELNLDLEASSRESDGLSIHGVAKEPGDVWGRPASGYVHGYDETIELMVSFPLYLRVQPEERSLLRIAIKNPQLDTSNDQFSLLKKN